MAAIDNVSSDINQRAHKVAPTIAHCSVGGLRDCSLAAYKKFFKFEDSKPEAHQQLRSGKAYEERVTT
jgi:hypothetical protein